MFNSLKTKILRHQGCGPTDTTGLELAVSTPDPVFFSRLTDSVAIEGLFGPSQKDKDAFADRRNAYVELLSELIDDMRNPKIKKEDDAHIKALRGKYEEIKTLINDKKPDPEAFSKIKQVGESTLTQKSLTEIAAAYPKVVILMSDFLRLKMPMTWNDVFKNVDSGFRAAKSISSMSPLGAYSKEEDPRAYLADTIADIHIGVKNNAYYENEKGNALLKDAGYTPDFPEKFLPMAERAFKDAEDCAKLSRDGIIALFQSAKDHVSKLSEDKKASVEALQATRRFTQTGMDLVFGVDRRVIPFLVLNHGLSVVLRIAKTYK